MLIDITTDENSILYAISMYIFWSTDEYGDMTRDEAIAHFKSKITGENLKKATEPHEKECE